MKKVNEKYIESLINNSDTVYCMVNNWKWWLSFSSEFLSFNEKNLVKDYIFINKFNEKDEEYLEVHAGCFFLKKNGCYYENFNAIIGFYNFYIIFSSKEEIILSDFFANFFDDSSFGCSEFQEDFIQALELIDKNLFEWIALFDGNEFDNGVILIEGQQSISIP